MKVYADFRQQVSINPIEVIENLIEGETGSRNWTFIKDGKFYIGYEISAGSHSHDEYFEITKEKYDYITALEFVLAYLKRKD